MYCLRDGWRYAYKVKIRSKMMAAHSEASFIGQPFDLLTANDEAVRDRVTAYISFVSPARIMAVQQIA